MVNIIKQGILLKKTILDFESEAVLNPATIREGEFVHLFYRAVSHGNHSCIGYCKLKGPLTVIERNTSPVIVPEFEYESHGVEDPRIVKIEDLYYLTYTAYDGVNALGALAISKDLIHFDKIGLIVPQITWNEFVGLADSKKKLNTKYERYNDNKGLESDQDKKVLVWDKNVIFFPRKINGKFYFLHRIKPDIQIIVRISSLDELSNEFWKNYLLHLGDYIFMAPKYPHEVNYIGGGCPPVETSKGWLLIYHGVHDTIKGFVYSACAALLDIENPQKEIS